MDAQEIRAVHDILHLVYHRNKNQHRHAKWWKWLSQLKRTALDLGSRESTKVAVAVSPSHREYLSTHLIPRCYLAFSTVVAENQFMALGIVLMATLSRFAKAAGIKLKEKVEKRPNPKAPVKKISSAAPAPVEDRGERVSRADLGAVASSELETEVAKPKGKAKKSSMTVDEPAAAPAKKLKKTKKKKNAIDDLFSGLL
ncbi:hypothetical protein N7539_003163 [Penicillium diatomitis]|uniref:RNase MRP protein 1 RNA binding domain-containing protein n=1 Tax=Penicillium diatomitis TaxID=2819901 RepID=A0A9W9XGA5_9EURO|nr:uncharacterized protein N7539_003163 [Penicillium diatomitis]KAJ5491596.1 hypothetical protein N7539_003163 [Penicillium diatomitis]